MMTEHVPGKHGNPETKKVFLLRLSAEIILLSFFLQTLDAVPFVFGKKSIKTNLMLVRKMLTVTPYCFNNLEPIFVVNLFHSRYAISRLMPRYRRVPGMEDLFHSRYGYLGLSRDTAYLEWKRCTTKFCTDTAYVRFALME